MLNTGAAMIRVSIVHVKAYRNTEQLKLSLQSKLQLVSNKCEYANLSFLENESKLEIWINIWASIS